MTKINRRLLLGATVCAALPGQAFAARSAVQEVARQRALAANAGRGLMIEFFASWCVWCRPMEALLADPGFARVVRPHFQIMRLRVTERRAEMRAQQAPDADEIYFQYAGRSEGLPFLAFLGANGPPIATSAMVEGGNVGFPVEPDELDRFEALFAMASPRFTAGDRAAIRAACARALARVS